MICNVGDHILVRVRNVGTRGGNVCAVIYNWNADVEQNSRVAVKPKVDSGNRELGHRIIFEWGSLIR